MKRILTLTAIALGLSGGIALADRNNGRGRGGRSEVRDHRGDRVVIRNNTNRTVIRNNNRVDNRVRVQRQRPTFRNNRFYFSGGTYRTYNRPVINVRYRDYGRRPALIVENYDPVPGYIWMQGTWNWTGYEWSWVPGHYEVDQNYQDDYSPGFSASASFGY
jgi:hypothetical protein